MGGGSLGGETGGDCVVHEDAADAAIVDLFGVQADAGAPDFWRRHVMKQRLTQNATSAGELAPQVLLSSKPEAPA